jgi:RNA polymerase sigma-70 factor (ECF subfamily)
VVAQDDTTLMTLVARGDAAAFATLFDRHVQRVVRFCARFVNNPAHGEDLAQEVFLKLLRNAKAYKPTAQFKTFLFRVATNHCLNSMRRPMPVSEEKDEHEAQLLHLSAAETPEHVLEAKDVEGALQRALTLMSERERAAFSMCRFEGMAYRDIAEVLEASESAVKSLIHRASVRVMQELDSLAVVAPVKGVAHG